MIFFAMGANLIRRNVHPSISKKALSSQKESAMKEIAILDTSISSDNIGDEIIMDSINRIIRDIFPSAYIWRIASHERLSKRTKEFILRSSMCLIGGTNILSSYISYDALWPIDESDAKIFNEIDTVCVGTGWNDYMENPGEEASYILRLALSKNTIHSVRDSYTKDKMCHIGIRSINTSCPTTWMLNKKHCNKIPQKKAENALVTLTAWRKNPEKDSEIIKTIERSYKNLFFFPQMCEDYYYFKSLCDSNVKIVNPSLKDLDSVLSNEDIDFIGTRLHGGIRALQKKKRTLILSVDNRSKEIKKDINIPVLDRNGDLHEIEDWIHGNRKTDIKIPKRNIDLWKKQFI